MRTVKKLFYVASRWSIWQSSSNESRGLVRLTFISNFPHHLTTCTNCLRLNRVFFCLVADKLPREAAEWNALPLEMVQNVRFDLLTSDCLFTAEIPARTAIECAIICARNRKYPCSGCKFQNGRCYLQELDNPEPGYPGQCHIKL